MTAQARLPAENGQWASQHTELYANQRGYPPSGHRSVNGCSQKGSIDDRARAPGEGEGVSADALVSFAATVVPSRIAILSLAACALPGFACAQAAVAPAADLASLAPPTSRRVLLAPVDVAVIGSGEGDASVMPDSVALGRERSGTVFVLMRFAATWDDGAKVASAFVRIAPDESALPATKPLRVEVARILEPWSSDTVSWGRKPETEVPALATWVTPRLAAPVRIDVTPIVRGWASRKADEHGIAMVAEPVDEAGFTFSMGMSRGSGPRLEVYVQ